MNEEDLEYIISRHDENIKLLNHTFGTFMFTIRQAMNLGISYEEFAIMCADGVIKASWFPRGAFFMDKNLIKD